jgi:hypothetical protein
MVTQLLTLLCLVLAPTLSTAFGFGFFSRTNQGNVTLPSTQAAAQEHGWMLSKRADGSPCRAGLGFEYTEGEASHSRSRPLSLFFDPAGRLSALSVRAWFDSSDSFNPLTWQEPPSFGSSNSDTDGSRWITVNTRDPEDACKETAETQSNGDVLGDRLLVNAGGAGSARVHIPTEAPADPSGAWKRGACMPNMSQHWGYPLDGRGDSLLGADHGIHVLPINPMYSVPVGPGHGQVTALAFFTTEPQVTQRDGGVWDASGTPAQLCEGNYCVVAEQCQYGESNSVFHVFFIDQWADAAQCEPVGSPGC